MLDLAHPRAVSVIVNKVTKKCFSALQVCFSADLLTEQSFFEKVKQLSQCQDEFLSQTQEHLKLKEEFHKLGKCAFIPVLDYMIVCLTVGCFHDIVFS